MILSCCKYCEYHSIIKIDGHVHSRCLKENCLVIYSKCFTDKAVKKFLRENDDHKKKLENAALDICYPKA
jgi:hypothetical protein